MIKYLKYFRFWFIAIIALAIILGIILFSHNMNSSLNNYSRNNLQTDTNERVFDYANVLTDKEESKLRDLIAKREKQIGCDIIIVTINEDLSEFAKQKAEGYVYIDEYPMVYADNFYIDHIFGFNEAYGDGALYLDNWYKESDGYRYTWFLTSGKVMDKYTDAMISNMTTIVAGKTNTSPYNAYKAYVNTLYHDMTGSGAFNFYISDMIVIIVSVIIGAIYIIINLSGNTKKKTTMATTYVNGGRAKMNSTQDLLVSQHVTQRVIQTNSGGRGGGGGGGMHSSGGHSFGGGGGRH